MRTTHRPALVAVALALALTACGSNLEPAEVAAANGGQIGGEALVPGEQLGTAAPPADVTDGAQAAGEDGSTSGGAPGGQVDGAPGGQVGGPAAEAQGSDPAAGTSGGPKGGAAACTDLKSGTGITKDKIVIANVSDISGPVPGLFQSSQDATKAYVAYFNRTSTICGRKLELLPLDSRTDAGGDQQGYVQACSKAFAAVGSMAGFDNGGAKAAADCGLPDLRAAGVSVERQKCSTCFAADTISGDTFQNAVPDRIVKDFPEAAKNAAMLYINAATAPANAKGQVNAMQRRGMRFVYVQGIDISDFNYAPYVQQMKSKGVRHAQFLGPYQNALRLLEAMKQQNFKLDYFAYDPTAYDAGYVKSGGDAAEGTRVFLNTAMFEEAGSNKEMALYLSWLKQVKPGAQPTYFGLFSWSATRLFVEQAQALGPKLDRPALIASLKKVTGWTANGLHAPQAVGPKKTGECWRWIILKGGKWVPDGPSKYSCTGLSSTS